MRSAPGDDLAWGIAEEIDLDDGRSFPEDKRDCLAAFARRGLAR
ncbi:MAG TPA: hypothetical protein VKY89_00105 [Thermoanaerobaculia bacterium]|nr:hypothetical protein [Thermoanaerobaculia bacterium]